MWPKMVMTGGRDCIVWWLYSGMVGMMMTVVEMINNDELPTWIIFTLRSSVQLVHSWADWAEQTDKIRSLGGKWSVLGIAVRIINNFKISYSCFKYQPRYCIYFTPINQILTSWYNLTFSSASSFLYQIFKSSLSCLLLNYLLELAVCQDLS